MGVHHTLTTLSHHPKKNPKKTTTRKPATLLKFLAHRYCHRITARILGKGLQSYDLSWKICRTARRQQDLPHNCFLRSAGLLLPPPQLSITVPPHNKMKRHSAPATESLKSTKKFRLLILTKYILTPLYN